MVTDNGLITKLRNIALSKKATQLQAPILLAAILCCLLLAPYPVAAEDSIAPNLGDQEAGETATTKQSQLSLLEQQSQTALANNADPDQIVWLELDPSVTSSQELTKYLGLQVEPMHPETQGGALVIPDEEQHADWPGIVRQLRTQLPLEGWHTLSISLPWRGLSTPPKRELEAKTSETYVNQPTTQKSLLLGARAQPTKRDQEQSTKENNNAESGETENVDINLTKDQSAPDPSASYEKKALSLINKAMEKLEKAGFQNITIIAIGKSAEIALQYAKNRNGRIGKQGLSLILVSPDFPSGDSNTLTDMLGKEFKAPILDVIDQGNRREATAQKLRKTSSAVAKFSQYHTLRIPIVETSSSQQALIKRLSDWLRTYAPGKKKGR